MNPFYNRYGLEVKLDWVSKTELYIFVEGSQFMRSSVNDIGDVIFIDFEGGPFLEIGQKIVMEDRKLQIEQLSHEKGKGHRIQFKEIWWIKIQCKGTI